MISQPVNGGRPDGEWRPQARGFTFIEIVAVLVLIGIVGALAAARLAAIDPYRLTAETDAVKNLLRYAQLKALADEVPWKISFTAASYTLLRNDTPAHLPAEATATRAFAGGVTITSGAVTVAFDEWGSPGPADITLTLGAGGEARSVLVTKNTGFIP